MRTEGERPGGAAPLVPVDLHKLEGMQCERGGVLRRQRLPLLLVLALLAVGPVADGFDEDPVDLPSLTGDVDPLALHLAADCLLLEGAELVPEVEVVEQLRAGEDRAEP